MLWRMAKLSRDSFSCPVCGEDVPGGAKSCPECGACERSGWSADADYDGLDLPGDDDFDYVKVVGAEFGVGTKKTGPKKLWLVATVLVLLGLLWSFVGGCFRG